jgi:hypothetical protein
VGYGIQQLDVSGNSCPFGKVFADESIGVLVGSSLPWGMSVGEVDIDLGFEGERGVLGHLPMALS